MIPTETLEEFYKHKFDGAAFRWLPDNLQRDLGHFNVFRLDDYVGVSAKPVPYSRRDFYKISVVSGHNAYHYADKSIEIDGPTLLFFNPQVPYTWESLSGDMTGYFCVFTEAFFAGVGRTELHELPMFKPGGKPAYELTEPQFDQLSALFLKMQDELYSDYQYKYGMIRNYVSEVMHTALKLQPLERLYQHLDAKSRITTVFTELLERQFPVEPRTKRFTLRSAGDFARHLSVHVNYLNRSVRETTGKTTTDHIAERVVSEAKALLKHTDWNIAEISYSLGFDEPAHFNRFFRKQTQLTPSVFRQV